MRVEKCLAFSRISVHYNKPGVVDEKGVKKMLIKYICKNCNEERYFSNPQENVICKKCGNKMISEKDDIAVSVLSTEESRYLGDEAMFNTIGNRISNKINSRHTFKTN